MPPSDAPRSATEPGSPGDAQWVVPCEDLDRSLAFYTERLGFRLDTIFPADAPRVAVLSRPGLRIRLTTEADQTSGLHLSARDLPRDAGSTMTAPEGTEIRVTPSSTPVELPPLRPNLVVSRAGGDAWSAGRAGMLYRDLIPDRLGGRYIASHIRIPEGGPVPDYVHHHAIRFQLIYCRAGWVRVAYEDQGNELVMRAGDCVLQPPHIRHRVLECSDGLEVVEVACPAEHETLVDHELVLPTGRERPDRDFSGQRFVFHQSQAASWSSGPAGFEVRDTGILAASDGVAATTVVRRVSGAGADALDITHRRELWFGFVLDGSTVLRCAGRREPLAAGEAIAVPADTEAALVECSGNFELLRVESPAN